MFSTVCSHPRCNGSCPSQLENNVEGNDQGEASDTPKSKVSATW